MASIDFVLDAFATSKNMDVSATLDTGAPPSTITDVSATAVYYITTETLKSVFRFSSNSWDINDVSADDIHYFTFMENWPTNLQINPANGMMDKSDSDNAILQGLSAEKMLVKHDFVRLEDKNIKGNGHMMMHEKNSSDIANFINQWIKKVY